MKKPFAWAKNKGELVMPTAYGIQDAQRQALERNKKVEHLQPAPEDENLIHGRIVLPGGHMLPDGLSLSRFNEIRQDHEVWIDLPQPNVIQIRARFIRNLKEATKAVNWLIHNMRFETGRPEGCYFVQPQSLESPEAFISLKVGDRPQLMEPTSRSGNIKDMSKIFETTFTPRLIASVEAMRGLTKNIQMRVTFGRIELSQKPANIGSEISYPDYKRFMNRLSCREPAAMGTRIHNPKHADELVDILTNPDHNPGLEYDDIERNCSLILHMAGGYATMEVPDLDARVTKLPYPEFVKIDQDPRLNWVFTAPDMNLDWRLRADLLTFESSISPAVEKIVAQRIKVAKPPKDESTGNFQVPVVRVTGKGSQDQDVEKVEVRQSIIIPFGMTSYVVKVSVSRVWNGLQTQTYTNLWGVELYARQWDIALNHTTPGWSHKDWGEELESVWSGEHGDSLETRVGMFFECILKVQKMLENLK